MANENITINIIAKDNASSQIKAIQSSLNGLKSTNVNLNVKGLDQATNSMKNFVQSTNQLSSGLGTSMNGMINNMTRLNTVTGSVGSNFKILGQNMFQMGNSTYQIQSRLAGTGTVVNNLGSAFSAIDPATGRAVAGFKNLDGQLTQTYSKLNSASTSTDKAATSFGKLGNAVRTVGTYMASMIGFNAMLSFSSGVMDAASAMSSLSTMMQTWGYTAAQTKSTMNELIAISNKYGMAMSDLQSTVGVIHSLVPSAGASDLAKYTESLSKFRLVMISLGESSSAFRMTQDNLLDSLNKGDSSMLKRTALWSKLDAQTRQSMEALFAYAQEGPEQMKDATDKLFKIMDEWADKNVDLAAIMRENPWEAWSVLVNAATNSVATQLQNLAPVFASFINGLKGFVDSPLFGQLVIGAGAAAVALGGLWVAMKAASVVTDSITAIRTFGTVLGKIITQIMGIDVGKITEKLKSIFNMGGTGKTQKTPTVSTPFDLKGLMGSLTNWKNLASNLKSIAAGFIVAAAAITAAMALIWIASEEMALFGNRFKQIEDNFKKGFEGVTKTMLALALISPLIAAIAIVGSAVGSTGWAGLAFSLIAIGAGALVVAAAISAAMADIWVASEEIAKFGERYAVIQANFEKGAEGIRLVAAALANMASAVGSITKIEWELFQQGLLQLIGWKTVEEYFYEAGESLQQAATAINSIEIPAVTEGKGELIRSVSNIIIDVVNALQGVTNVKEAVRKISDDRTTPGRQGNQETDTDVKTVITTAANYIRDAASAINGVEIPRVNEGLAQIISTVTTNLSNIVNALQGVTNVISNVNSLSNILATGGLTGWEAIKGEGEGTSVTQAINSAVGYINEVAGALNAHAGEIQGWASVNISVNTGGITSSLSNLSSGVSNVQSAYLSLPSVEQTPSLKRIEAVVGYIQTIRDYVVDIPNLGMESMSFDVSGVVNSLNNLKKAQSDVQSAYDALPSVSGTPSTEKIKNLKGYIQTMREAVSGSTSISDILDRFRGNNNNDDEAPMLLGGPSITVNNDSEYNDYVTKGATIKRVVEVDITVDHTSSDKSISTLEVVRSLREYTGSIFTPAQIRMLANEIRKTI